MTFKEALEYIEINGLYHKEGSITYKLKVAPLNPLSLMKYQNDLLIKKKVLTNDDAKTYSNEDNFIIIPYDVNYLAEEKFQI